MIASANLTTVERQILEQGLPHLECSRHVTVSHNGGITTLSTSTQEGEYLLGGSLKDGLLHYWGIGKKFTVQ